MPGQPNRGKFRDDPSRQDYGPAKGPGNGPPKQPFNGWKPGEPNPRAGKLNLRSSQIVKDLRDALRRKCPDYSPLLRLVEIAEDKNTAPELAVQCHIAILPYLVPKTTALPIDVKASIAYETDLAKARSGAIAGEVAGLAERLERARARMGDGARARMAAIAEGRPEPVEPPRPTPELKKVGNLIPASWEDLTNDAEAIAAAEAAEAERVRRAAAVARTARNLDDLVMRPREEPGDDEELC